MTDNGRAERAEQVITVFLAPPMCRRCVRVLSHRVSDVLGVSSVEVDATAGRLRVRGGMDGEQLLAAVRSAGFVVTPAPGAR
jgi:hypothetical protein